MGTRYRIEADGEFQVYWGEFSEDLQIGLSELEKAKCNPELTNARLVAVHSDGRWEIVMS